MFYLSESVQLWNNSDTPANWWDNRESQHKAIKLLNTLIAKISRQSELRGCEHVAEKPW